MLKPEHQFLLPQLAALHWRLMAAFSRTVGIHPSRFRILYVLHVLGESSPGALLRWTMSDAAALTRMMKDFEAEGLIARRTDPADARSRFAVLTPEGTARVVELLKARDRFVADALTGLDSDETALLSALLRRVEANVSRLAGLPAIGEGFNIDPGRPEE